MKQVVAGAVPFTSGVLFGSGLVLSGMTRPEKVIGFLDWFGAWDASLLLVMAAAVVVHFAAYRWIRRRPTPLIARDWSLPPRRAVDFRLVLGATAFGLGWGLSGYCPGPAVVSLAGASPGVVVFTLAMLLGMVGAARLETAARGCEPREALSSNEPTRSADG